MANTVPIFDKLVRNDEKSTGSMFFHRLYGV